MQRRPAGDLSWVAPPPRTSRPQANPGRHPGRGHSTRDRRAGSEPPNPSPSRPPAPRSSRRTARARAHLGASVGHHPAVPAADRDPLGERSAETVSSASAGIATDRRATTTHGSASTDHVGAAAAERRRPPAVPFPKRRFSTRSVGPEDLGAPEAAGTAASSPRLWRASLARRRRQRSRPCSGTVHRRRAHRRRPRIAPRQERPGPCGRERTGETAACSLEPAPLRDGAAPPRSRCAAGRAARAAASRNSVLPRRSRLAIEPSSPTGRCTVARRPSRPNGTSQPAPEIVPREPTPIEDRPLVVAQRLPSRPLTRPGSYPVTGLASGADARTDALPPVQRRAAAGPPPAVPVDLRVADPIGGRAGRPPATRARPRRPFSAPPPAIPLERGARRDPADRRTAGGAPSASLSCTPAQPVPAPVPAAAGRPGSPRLPSWPTGHAVQRTVDDVVPERTAGAPPETPGPGRSRPRRSMPAASRAPTAAISRRRVDRGRRRGGGCCRRRPRRPRRAPLRQDPLPAEGGAAPRPGAGRPDHRPPLTRLLQGAPPWPTPPPIPPSASASR